MSRFVSIVALVLIFYQIATPLVSQPHTGGFILDKVGVTFEGFDGF